MSRDAVVVGINFYQYLPSLNAPASDAEAIAQRLQTNGEFRVARLPEIIQSNQPRVGRKTPVTLRELEAALVRLFKPPGTNIPQTALFYFSGHGLQKQAGIREGYLALSDSHPDMGFYGLSLFWLRRLLQESPVRQQIVLLDCCHSGELLHFLDADPGSQPGTDRLLMAASREYESAYESLESKYSVFTQALLTGLNPSGKPSKIVTNYSLTNWVSQKLKGELQQPLFDNSGSEIILTRHQNVPSSLPLPPPPPPPPSYLPGDRRTGQKGGETALVSNPQLLERQNIAFTYTRKHRQENKETNRCSYRDRCNWRTLKLWRFALPAVLLITLAGTFNGYRTVRIKTAEKKRELGLAKSRAWAAIARTLAEERNGNPSTALAIAHLAIEKGGRTDEARASLRDALQKHQLQAELRGHQGVVNRIAFSPDRRYLATAGEDSTLRLWSLETRTAERVIHLSADAIGRIAFGPRGKTIAVAIADNTVQIWDAKTGELLRVVPSDDPQTGNVLLANAKSASSKGNPIAVSPDETLLLTVEPQVVGDGDLGDRLQLWDAVADRPLGTLRGHRGSVKAAAFGSDGTYVATAGTDGIVRLWAIALRGDLPALKMTGKPAMWASFLDGTEDTAGSEIVAVAADGTLERARLLAGRPHKSRGLKFNLENLLTGFAVSRNGQLMATADTSGKIAIWCVRGNETISLELVRYLQNDHLRTSALGIRQLTFSPDGQQLLGAGDDLTLRLWEVESGQLLQVFQGHQATISDAELSRDGDRVITASWDRTARIWQVSSGRVLTILPHRDVVSSAAFSPDGTVAVTSSWDKTAKFWDAATGKSRGVLTGHAEAVLDARFSPDGRSLVTASADGTARLWDPRTGKEIALLQSASSSDDTEPSLRQAFFSPDGQYAGSLSQNGQLYLWASTWESLQKLARDRLPRQLTPEECWHYLHLPFDRCPKIKLGF